MAETLCTSGAVKLRAGTYANTTLTNSAADMTTFINQAEGELIAETRCNWIDIYGSMNDDFKKVVEGATACKAAIKVIMYDPSSFINTAEAATMVNVLWAEYDRSVNALKDNKVIGALGGSIIT